MSGEWDRQPRLEAILRWLLPEPSSVRRILEIGCGNGGALRTLRRVFPGAATVILGIDRDWRAVYPAPGIGVCVADAAWLPLARQAGFDLILIRHPDVDRRAEGWRQVCAATAGRLVPGGLLLVTAYTAHEMGRIQAWLADVSVWREADCELLGFRLPPADLAGHDRIFKGLWRVTG